MNHSIQAIYENGLLRPLEPLDLEENSVVEIDVRDVKENGAKKSANEGKLKAFHEWMENLDPNAPVLTDEQISRESIYEEQIQRQL
jgi:predicted DNA-binding antitoxin AbrB/MazE fold protein